MSTHVRFSDADRRARLVARHHLGREAADPVQAVRAVVASHSTDPATPYLAARARVSGFTTGDLDRALLDRRALWRLHAMRRTLFVVDATEGGVFEAAASRDVARRERRRLEGWLAGGMDAARVQPLLSGLEQKVLEALADGAERRTQELTARVPELGTEITLGSGKWSTRTPMASRFLFLMAMDGRIVRTRPAGSWRSSQYHWADAVRWFGEERAPMDDDAARIALARRYLARHGPATLEDVRWWTGWTARQTAAAVAAVATVPARLDDGREGLVLADDTDAVPVPAPSATLLPALDSSPMGWKHRDWFLGDHASRLFDRSGNIGPSVWVDGRIVGGWAQRRQGDVVYRLLEDVGVEAERAVVQEAAELTTWLGGTVITPRFRTPLERELSDTGG
jgi:hypothetical protein